MLRKGVIADGKRMAFSLAMKEEKDHLAVQ